MTTINQAHHTPQQAAIAAPLERQLAPPVEWISLSRGEHVVQF